MCDKHTVFLTVKHFFNNFLLHVVEKHGSHFRCKMDTYDTNSPQNKRPLYVKYLIIHKGIQ